jgi:lysophospholipid acyltransferase 5
MWLACKVALMKYLGVWLLGEGVCILAGIGFAGYNKDGKSEGWHRLANVKPGQFETSLNLQGIIESFNINTNDWVKRYIFKRLKFLNNRDISLLAALFFLALWHGFAPGYFLCFLLEFVDMSAEKKLQVLLQPLNNAIERSNVLIRYVYYAICWIIRTFALHYGLISFEVKSWKASLAAYGALYYIGHIAVLLVFIAHMLFAPKRKRTPTNTTPSTSTAAADTKKKV